MTMDMFTPYFTLVKQLFPKAKIVLDRFHIVQHLSGAMNRVRIQIMNQFDKQPKEYRRLKRYWKIIQTDSRKLSTKRTYQPMFQMHLTSQEILDELRGYSEELNQHYQLYQMLLFQANLASQSGTSSFRLFDYVNLENDRYEEEEEVEDGADDSEEDDVFGKFIEEHQTAFSQRIVNEDSYEK